MGDIYSMGTQLWSDFTQNVKEVQIQVYKSKHLTPYTLHFSSSYLELSQRI